MHYSENRSVLNKFFHVVAQVSAMREKEVQHLYELKHTELGVQMAKDAATEGIDALWASAPFEDEGYYADALADAGQYVSLLAAADLEEGPADRPASASATTDATKVEPGQIAQEVNLKKEPSTVE